MRCAILALAAVLLTTAGSAANACDQCETHGNNACGKSYGCKGSAVRPLGLRPQCGGCAQCGGCDGCAQCGVGGRAAGLLSFLHWRGSCIRCGIPGMHGGGMPIGPGGPYTGPSGPPVATYGYPFYTTRGPRDFLMDNPPTIGR